MSEVTNHVPCGWVEASLGDIALPTRPRVSPSEQPEARFVGMEHVEAHTMRIIDTVPAGSMKSSCVSFREGDVLYGRLRPYLNKVVRPDFDGLCSAEFIVFPGQEHLDNRFLQYRLNAWDFVQFASRLNAGDRPRVDYDQIAPYPVLLPPLNEQSRIVAEIDKQFSRLDAGVAALRRVEANLKRYKAAVLKAACTGALTADWRAAHPDVEPASKLLDRILKQRRRRWEEAELAKLTAKGKPPKDGKWKAKYKEPTGPATATSATLNRLPSPWVHATIDQLTENHDGRRIPVKAKDRADRQGQYPYYGASGVIDYVDDYLFDGDYLLIAEDGANLLARSTPIAFKASGQFWVNNHAHVMTLLAGMPLEYLEAFLNGYDLRFSRNWLKTQRQADPSGRFGSRYSIVRLSRWHRLKNRSAILRRSRFKLFSKSIAQQLMRPTVLSVGDTRSDRLRQSILKDAFEGKLVEQDPTRPACVAAWFVVRLRAGVQGRQHLHRPNRGCRGTLVCTRRRTRRRLDAEAPAGTIGALGGTSIGGGCGGAGEVAEDRAWPKVAEA